MSAALQAEIQSLAADLPRALVDQLAELVAANPAGDWNYLGGRIQRSFAQPRYQAGVRRLLQVWETEAPAMPAAAVALALQSAAGLAEALRTDQTLSLVWTGPDTRLVPLRRTDQALLEVIDRAERQLLVVSFAVYRAGSIVDALLRAAGRGVDITICLETPEASDGHMSGDTLRALGRELRQRARLYIWPLDQRPPAPNGRRGSLHAKLAVADGRLLFVSSANLTEYAMLLNMELGVLIEGGQAPGQIQTHFARLIQDGVLSQVDDVPPS